jgi:hypothetical protein
MTPNEQAKPSTWKAYLKAVAFAALAAATTTTGYVAQSFLTTGSQPPSWSTIGTGAALSGLLGAAGYILRSPFHQENPPAAAPPE